MSKDTFQLVWGALTIFYLLVLYVGRIKSSRAKDHLSHSVMTFFLFVTITGLILNAFVE